jgi:hypothetical protein
MLVVDLTLQGTIHQVSLWFDERQGLERIEVIEHESEWFWDDSPSDELEATHEEYQRTNLLEPTGRTSTSRHRSRR